MTVLISREPEDLSIDGIAIPAIEDAAAKVSELYSLEKAELSVTLTDNLHIQAINRRYRGIDRPTDVISFALNESEEPEIQDAEVNILGDIIISLERAAEQAAEYGHSYRREVAFLTVHGLLHLLGYDHMEDEERQEMEEEQRVIMEALGISR